MTEKTLQTLTTRLYKEVSNHAHREELIELMYQQLRDDVTCCGFENSPAETF